MFVSLGGVPSFEEQELIKILLALTSHPIEVEADEVLRCREYAFARAGLLLLGFVEVAYKSLVAGSFLLDLEPPFGSTKFHTHTNTHIRVQKRD